MRAKSGYVPPQSPNILFPVPATYSAEMLITNMGWDLQLTNRDSDLFQLLAREIQQNILTIFHSDPVLAVQAELSIVGVRDSHKDTVIVGHARKEYIKIGIAF